MLTEAGGDTNAAGGGGDTNPQPKMKTFELSPDTRFDLPEDTVIPESLANSAREKDKTLRVWGEEKKKQTERIQELERKLGDYERSTTIPDPMDDPVGHAKYITDSAREVARKETLDLQNKGDVHRAEVGTAADLVNTHFGDDMKAIEDPVKRQAFFDEKLKSVARRIAEYGAYEKIGDGDEAKYLYRRGAVEAAFNSLYMGDLISKAEKRGEGKMGQQLEESAGQPKPIPVGKGETGYASVDERLAKDRAGTMDAAFEEMSKETQSRRERK